MAARMIPVARPRHVELWHEAPARTVPLDEDRFVSVTADIPRRVSEQSLRETPIDWPAPPLDGATPAARS